VLVLFRRGDLGRGRLLAAAIPLLSRCTGGTAPGRLDGPAR